MNRPMTVLPYSLIGVSQIAGILFFLVTLPLALQWLCWRYVVIDSYEGGTVSGVFAAVSAQFLAMLHTNFLAETERVPVALFLFVAGLTFAGLLAYGLRKGLRHKKIPAIAVATCYFLLALLAGWTILLAPELEPGRFGPPAQWISLTLTLSLLAGVALLLWHLVTEFHQAEASWLVLLAPLATMVATGCIHMAVAGVPGLAESIANREFFIPLEWVLAQLALPILSLVAWGAFSLYKRWDPSVNPVLSRGVYVTMSVGIPYVVTGLLILQMVLLPFFRDR